ncbi:MAG: M48 family metallopeptidase [Nitrospira sp.]|nr:M48 family metallopeptidase [Nitrospira sp.]
MVIELRVRPDTDAVKQRAVLAPWYRQRLREAIPPLLAKWEECVGVKMAKVWSKTMKTR